MNSHSTVVYPGTFDPITNGHLDIIKKGVKIFGKLYVAVALNESKKPLFSIDERRDLIKKTLQNENCDNVEVIAFDGLLVDLCAQINAKIILRGLRVISDFEYEFQMACVNSQMSDKIETLFIPASEKTQFISSRVVKQIATDIDQLRKFVPTIVAQELHDRFSKNK